MVFSIFTNLRIGYHNQFLNISITQRKILYPLVPTAHFSPIAPAQATTNLLSVSIVDVPILD